MMKEQKVEYAAKVAEELKAAEGIILAFYQGITFPQMNLVRQGIKGGGNDFRVIKNTLLKKALNSINITALDSYLANSTVLVIVRKDFASAAKVLKKYVRDFAPLGVKAGLMGNKILSESDILTIADLPPREELLAKALATMNAPVTNFVSVLSNIPRSLVNVLNAIKDKKVA
jgi:large subunit ribosomal protein L10